MTRLDSEREERLRRLALALVDQQRARILVAPQRAASGFWFGGGNLTQGPDGGLYLVGRYRNQGDSRTGLAAGERGLELALFRSLDGGQTFEKRLQWSKSELDQGQRRVLSIEGSALYWNGSRVELYVSSEKAGIGYPQGLETYLKPGTGVWTIERLAADSVAGLKDARPETVLSSTDPRYLHLKDPVVYQGGDRRLLLLFCSHPFNWSSSNSGYAVGRGEEGQFEPPVFECFPRGTTWDVAMTRVTACWDVPRVGALADRQVTLVFYDGGECVRQLDPHAAAVARPRGYSCEELGGVGYFVDGRIDSIQRLSTLFPLLVSPHGTGCSRYVDVLSTGEGAVATWQQAQPDGSQPLVTHRLSREAMEAILGG